MISVCAGIVTYNPDLTRLEENINAVINQCLCVIVCDNSSDNSREIESLCRRYSVLFISNSENKGLGQALNRIFNTCPTECKWVLTLDQDSVIPSDYVKACERYCCDDVGIISPLVYEKNSGKMLSKSCKGSAYTHKNRVITSAALVNMNAFVACGGYDEELFIDYVDFDFCYRVRLCKYTIIQMNDQILNHELGNSSTKRFLFWKIRLTDHSALRDYYVGRNIIIFVRRYRKEFSVWRDIGSLLKRYLFILLFFSDKSNKLRSLSRGVRDGFKWNNL